MSMDIPETMCLMQSYWISLSEGSKMGLVAREN